MRRCSMPFVTSSAWRARDLMRIGIVNDLKIAVEAQRRALAQRPAHEIAWVAVNGAEAIEQCSRQPVDLVLMDLMMPLVDGVAATRRIMDESPCAILIVTARVGTLKAQVFEAMGYGALDAVDTPGVDAADGVAAFLKKIDTIDRLVGPRSWDRSSGDTTIIRNRERLIVLGASAGGPAALATILGGLPADLPAGVVIIQHVDEQFAQGMAQWLGQQCRLPVRVVEENERLRIGTVLLAGTNEHLQFKSRDRLGYTTEPREALYRPSIDVFFHSVCRHWMHEAIGVLLTGMGRDGAEGLKAMRGKGHLTIAQDGVTSAVYGMPKAAVSLGAAVDVLPLERIAPRLLEAVSYRSFAKG
jgi:chemotaxis response regulator CheB